MTTKLYITDLDGTLANIDHRLHHIQGEHKDYKKFFAECINDKRIDWVANLLGFVRHDGDVLILSGRSDEVETETREWLMQHGILYDYIAMRPEGNNEPDHKLKLKMLDSFLRDKDYEVQFIIDDRQSVVDAWRKNGYNVLQCNKWLEEKELRPVYKRFAKTLQDYWGDTCDNIDYGETNGLFFYSIFTEAVHSLKYLALNGESLDEVMEQALSVAMLAMRAYNNAKKTKIQGSKKNG